jgi:putative membrane protein
MAVAGSILIAVAVVIHVALFSMQSATWSTTWRRFAVRDPAEAETLRPMIYRQGFFHLFLAVGAAIGLFFYWTKLHNAGFAVLLFCAGCMVLGAVVLLTMGRNYIRLALVEGAVPLVALVLLCLA